MRQKLSHFFVLIAAGLILGAGQLRNFNFGASELAFVSDLGFGAMAFFGSALTITATAQLFFAEIEDRTILTLLAKPVTRAEYVLGKFTAVAVIAAIFCGGLTVLLALVLWMRESSLAKDIPELVHPATSVNFTAVLCAGFAQWLKLVVLSAFTLLVASFARTQLFTVVTGFFVLVICHLQFLAESFASRGGPVATRATLRFAACIFPNFQLFDLTSAIAGVGVGWNEMGKLTLYGAGYAIVASVLAAVSFRAREI